MQKLIYRPFIITIIVLGLSTLLALGSLSSISWRNQQRINAIKQDIQRGNQLQQQVLYLLEHQRLEQSRNRISIKQRNAEHHQIIQGLKKQYSETNTNSQLLGKIHHLLLNIEQGKHQNQLQVLQLSHEVLFQQIKEEERLLDEVYQASQLELKLAILIPSSIFLILIFFGYFFLSRHVMTPIKALDELFSNLIKGERKPIKETNIDTVMQPLFNNYNELVLRLSELEEEHRLHTYSLEKKVRNATHTLLAQSHSLARADRLAAVGELAASTAHELRNPLAGILVALENILQDCHDKDMQERLQMVYAEINRLTGRLNDLLAFSKQAPEPAKKINLSLLINELMTLVGYQVKENISLSYQVEDNILIFLPENELRQALLNLLLNAIQSIGTQEGRVNLRVIQHEDKWMINITDTGAAFPVSLLKQGIRPFASYKEKGTGLGLPMVQRFAKSYGGALKLENTSEGHASASLIFPKSL